MIVALTLTSCSLFQPKETEGSTSEETTTVESSEATTEMSTTEETTEVTTTEATTTEETTETTTEETTEVTTEETTTEETSEGSEVQSGGGTFSENIADLDSRKFKINGKMYELGKSTLQELIDDGVPFAEEDLENANNNLKSNSESQAFKVVLDEFWSMMLRVSNFGEEGKPMAELPITELYLPAGKDRSTDIVELAFPLTITPEEVIASAGEPSKKDEGESNGIKSVKLEYKKDSEQYIGESGYTFEFQNDELKYFTMNFK